MSTRCCSLVADLVKPRVFPWDLAPVLSPLPASVRLSVDEPGMMYISGGSCRHVPSLADLCCQMQLTQHGSAFWKDWPDGMPRPTITHDSVWSLTDLFWSDYRPCRYNISIQYKMSGHWLKLTHYRLSLQSVQCCYWPTHSYLFQYWTNKFFFNPQLQETGNKELLVVL